jgi:muconate cycloisomerase
VLIRVRHVSIPMRYRFGHARAGRSVADNVLVEVELVDGARGWGECVPRDYVTGETVSSVFEALTTAIAQPALLPIDERADFAAAARVIAELDLPAALASERGPGLAAAAALELALLDAYARREGRSIFDAISLVPAYAALADPAPASTVTQTLTIGDELEAALTRAGALHSPPPVKLKLGLGLDRDLERAAAIRDRFGATVDLRGDANAAWDLATAKTTLARLGPLSSVEEPLAGRDLNGCATLRAAGVRVMLDESLCSYADAERAIAAASADLFNLRLSKCGGLFPTLRLVARAEQDGIGWQLGCMVGETGILSCLGRGFVGRVRGARYLESTVPTKSLEEDVTDAQLDHLPGTRETRVPTGPGFGAAVRTEVVERYTVARLGLAR